jgi:hypothetical protein
MLAHNFIGRVTFDSLRPLIPARHVAARIHQEDGIVSDALY